MAVGTQGEVPGRCILVQVLKIFLWQTFRQSCASQR
jgi:hypothetical protein